MSAASTTPPHSTHHHATHVTHHHATHVTHPHVTHEAVETEYFSFYYDPTSVSITFCIFLRISYIFMVRSFSNLFEHMKSIHLFTFTIHISIQHYIAAKSRHACYLYQTNAQEQIDVHTSHGLHTIEVWYVQMIEYPLMIKRCICGQDSD